MVDHTNANVTKLDIATQRLHNQRVEGTTLKAPSQVVARLGAVQAQDYAAAKWALGLRSDGVTDADVEQAFADGKILRTHVLRPTWHFVTPEDIRWLLDLTAPRVHASNAYQYRQLELNEAVFERGDDVLAGALQGGKHLTRSELATALDHAGIAAKGPRLAHLVMHAELQGLICSGARRGNQFTYALLEERAPQARRLERDEGLAELAMRYFSSRGPATLQDFVWWSGLTVPDARAGIKHAKAHLRREAVGGRDYWFTEGPAVAASSGVHLLPWFDEFLVAYKDRRAVLGPAHAKQVNAGGGLLNPTIISRGRVVGTWKSSLTKDKVALHLSGFASQNGLPTRAVARAVRRYSEFIKKPVVLAEG